MCIDDGRVLCMALVVDQLKIFVTEWIKINSRNPFCLFRNWLYLWVVARASERKFSRGTKIDTRPPNLFGDRTSDRDY